MEPKYLSKEVIIHPNHHLRRWLDPTHQKLIWALSIFSTKLSWALRLQITTKQWDLPWLDFPPQLWLLLFLLDIFFSDPIIFNEHGFKLKDISIARLFWAKSPLGILRWQNRCLKLGGVQKDRYLKTDWLCQKGVPPPDLFGGLELAPLKSIWWKKKRVCRRFFVLAEDFPNDGNPSECYHIYQPLVNFFCDLTRVLRPQKVAVWKGNTQNFQEHLGWWNIMIWPDNMNLWLYDMGVNVKKVYNIFIYIYI